MVADAGLEFEMHMYVPEFLAILQLTVSLCSLEVTFPYWQGHRPLLIIGYVFEPQNSECWDMMADMVVFQKLNNKTGAVTPLYYQLNWLTLMGTPAIKLYPHSIALE
jgi:hypothetical protein